MNIFQNFFAVIKSGLASILPLSPFTPYIDMLQDLPALGWLNWFVPVREILVIFAAWLVAVGLFYGYSILLRWLKVLCD